MNRYLKIENFDNQELGRNVKKEIIANTEGYLIFDDTVLNKKHSNKIELVRRQYSANEHKVVCLCKAALTWYRNSKLYIF